MIHHAEGHELIKYIGPRLPHPPESVGPGAFLTHVDGEIRAAWMFEPSVRGAYDLTVAADDPRWAFPGNLTALFRQAFIDLAAKRLMACIGETNKRSFKMARFMGFQPIGLLPRWYESGEGGWIMDMLAEDCRFLRS